MTGLCAKIELTVFGEILISKQKRCSREDVCNVALCDQDNQASHFELISVQTHPNILGSFSNGDGNNGSTTTSKKAISLIIKRTTLHLHYTLLVNFFAITARPGHEISWWEHMTQYNKFVFLFLFLNLKFHLHLTFKTSLNNCDIWKKYEFILWVLFSLLSPLLLLKDGVTKSSNYFSVFLFLLCFSSFIQIQLRFDQCLKKSEYLHTFSGNINKMCRDVIICKQ